MLSDVLRAVKLTGALFFSVDASSPWSVEVPQAEAFARIILPSAQHVISYHVVIQGSGCISIGDGPPLKFTEGDILVIPHGNAYAMRSDPGVRSGLSHSDSLDFFRAMAAGQLPFVVAEGGDGPATHAVRLRFPWLRGPAVQSNAGSLASLDPHPARDRGVGRPSRPPDRVDAG